MSIVHVLKNARRLRWALPPLEALDARAVEIRNAGARRAISRTLRHRSSVGALAIARAIDALPHPPQPEMARAVKLIEAERAALMTDTSPLDDGTLLSPNELDTGYSVAEACSSSKPPAPARLLYLLVREFAPSSALELGTNVGISSAFIALAIRDSGSTGRLTTLDASAGRMRVAAGVHRHLGISNIDYICGFFSDTLGSALDAIGPIDLVFVDGHHECDPTIAYFNRIAPYLAQGALVAFDDIRWSAGMYHAWKSLRDEPRFGTVVDLHSIGLCVMQGSSRGARFASSEYKLW